ncbi:hypothetical protein CO115_02235 [Candidatus Falkowbacteria bacterium CG_4_9_14_3_um_filter_36_9]|uniref:Glycosyltransferase subfamily 4-like N-terminal domain-containing protein n=2 Tax=Candidatus Falkowiibacteriota TaxID=1752728 RepID=A0A1J4TA78_9BACT|nr:MAG: hypothetical protein AUJ27_00195 [Candidatus Falkowbacteria bacterium CG1_02_37_44]PIV51991.1 MAG: hypothetical protein COS18_01120 [Candidatus Falkowbacteria bacterium CG02_land_8_20_14_3_00_36_14]PIX10824.1 MAG: hypothetical protein COZ73_04590 [Candidatus Falkowbacteria bacterium CG_4_8_14_3_um_filter_36_11]PJA11324.1 MAG: hypothetical protein COX67_00420 [Candidatus Falkowbacteria bacterium CG_4_10_14_0_2_um_filter_36_22]PJB19802.1 MAG: hypothetical protein CO115_02235 [Candidatus F
MPKILIVITKGEIGGAQNFVLNLAKKLKECKIEALVGYGCGDYLKNELKSAAIPYFNFKWLKRTHNPLANLFFIFELKNYLKNNNFSAVHFNSANALLGAIGAKLANKNITTIFTFHGLSVLDENYQAPKIIKIIYLLFFKILLLYVDKPIFISRKNLAQAQKIKLVKGGKIIFNGLEPRNLNFLSAGHAKNYFEKKFKINIQNKYLIGSIGRLVMAKNYEFIIDIFPEILKIKPEAALLIIGAGEKRKKFENMINNLKLADKIFLLGEINNACQYLKGFDLFVLPSRYEGLSITLIESLFAGTPILASSVGGNAEILDNSPNQLYEFNNKKEFLTKFKKLATDKNLSLSLGEKNLNQSKKFLLEETFKKYLKIYNK